MIPYLLIDFGSTYTKMTAVDLDGPRILGTAGALTTVNDGLILGYQNALRVLESRIGKYSFHERLACSSAAGGLKMAAIGLVPDLTVEAAKRAALGAGAKVIKTYSFQLSAADIGELYGLKPDLVLLTGGTDGGNREALLHNGRMLAASNVTAPIIIAGNKTVTPEVAEILKKAGKLCYRVPNVLPELDRLNVEPVQQAIREVFLKQIIYAKGLDQVQSIIDGIMMPTPAAVLEAAVRLADGDGRGAPGLGELMIIDVGGATTDVHSVAEGNPANPRVFVRGLKEPRVQRTVEGDLGMRYSAQALLEAYSVETVAGMTSLGEAEVKQAIQNRTNNPAYLPEAENDIQLEISLGFLAVKGAVERHVGRIEKVFTPNGLGFMLTGKDLTGLQTIIGTGGVLARSNCGAGILQGAMFEQDQPELLKPIAPDLYLDQNYVIPTLGLIAQEFPLQSFALLRESLTRTQ